jgi:hypothetical protein
MKKKQNKIVIAVGILLVSGMMILSSCSKENDGQLLAGSNPSEAEKVSRSLIFSPNANMYGKSMPEWIMDYTKWYYSFDCAHAPGFDTSGALQNQSQSGPVFFLAGKYNSNLSVTVPAGASIFMSMTGQTFSYPSPYYAPGPGQTPEELLDSLCSSYQSQFTGSSLIIDGVEVYGMGSFATQPFSFAPNADLQNCFYNPNYDGSQLMWMTSGSFVMLKPLEPGLHTITRSGTLLGTYTFYRTYHINQL